MKVYRNTIIIAVLTTVLAFGCAPSDTEGPDFSWVIEREGGLPDVNPLNVSGGIQIAGSSTVFPLAEALAARFNDEGYGFVVTIDSIGSGAGFERYCVAGESDIVNASRRITESELASCNAIGRSPIEMSIGVDALVVVVNPDNTWARNLTHNELAQVFTADRWSDVNATWPNRQIERFVPGTDSGTFDYFVEEVFDKDVAPLLEAPNTQFAENDNVLARGVAESPYAVGFFGFAYALNNSSVLEVVDIENVTPNYENVENGTYPLSRPLFMYYDAAVIAQRPQVGAFLAYVLHYVNDEIVQVGYFPISPNTLAQTRDALATVLRQVGAFDS